MLKNEIKCENLTKNNIIYRASLRGLKKCTSCGYINGQRALICRNAKCDLRIKRLAAIKPFDPIQLVTYGPTKYYSLRSKEKLLQPRNFVRITDAGAILETSPCAVCYVGNCKYDVLEPTHLVCRHIKACKVLTNVAVAEIYPIDKSILWNLNIPIEQKQHLWNLYQLEEKQIHPVQKLNSSIFVVKCVKSKIFPAGRLHVTVFSNNIPSKSGKFSCACKKLKIVLESDNSVVMKQEICDHLLLLLSAILNKPEGKMLYSKFLDLLQHLWMPTCLNMPIESCSTRPQFMDYGLSLQKFNKPNVKVGNIEESDNSDDIFNFTEDLFAENNIPDFSDIILNVNNEKVSNIPTLDLPKQTTMEEINIKDPKLNATRGSINDEEIGLNFPHIDSPQSLATSLDDTNITIPISFNDNGLSVIEQFQLNHNIQISNDNIELAKDIETLNNLECQVMETGNVLPACEAKQNSLLKSCSIGSNTEELTKKPCIIMKPTSLATFPVPKSVVIKQGSVTIIKIDKPIKKLPIEIVSKILQISKTNRDKLAVLKNTECVDSVKPIADACTWPQPNTMEDEQIKCTPVPYLSYESWLDYVIENLNEKISIQDCPSIESIFHVPQAIFNYFSKTFASNSKKKLSNETTFIKNAKRKDNVKYIWYFNEPATVQRIFKSKNMIIELERSYQRLADGSYELYSPVTTTLNDNKNFRTIYPKIQLYKVSIKFNNNSELCSNNLQPHKCGLKLEWLPSAFPKSNFGLMIIKFNVSVKQPDRIA